MGQTIDVDIYGRQNTDGSALEYFDSDAISEALRDFVMSKRGDFLYDPGMGGILDTPLFKVMTPDSMEMLRFRIRNAITNYFTPYIQLKTVDIIPDMNNRILQVNLIYYTQNSEIKQTTIYIASDFDYEKKTYTNVEHDGINLYNFCIAHKSEMGLEKLILDTSDNIWKWGIYAFINLTTEDEYFESILLIANG